MATPPNPPSDLPNTYLIQDRSQEKELTRVHLQDQLFTASMGGVLPEQPDPTIFQRILDVGCGTGNWLIEVAKTYPSIGQLTGVDVSGQVISYARTQAKAQQVADRVTFQKMDALRMLEFPANTFDLVNHRLGMSYLRTWEWAQLLQEYQRITKTKGIIRITECGLPTSTSSAFNRLCELSVETFYQAGYLFTRQRDGVIQELPTLFQRQGLQTPQTRPHTIVYRGNTLEGERYREDIQHTYRLLVPFFQKWIRLPNDYETLYQQTLKDMQDPDFTATLTLLTVWDTNRSFRRNPVDAG